MGSSLDVRALIAGLAVAAVGAAGCTFGAGDGEVVGSVSAPRCGLMDDSLDLRPSYFVADPADEGVLEIRIQRGSNFEDKSDGVAVSVLDAPAVKNGLLGTPIDFSAGDDAVVRMSLYLNDTCKLERDELPVNYTAVSGTITFESIYAPSVSKSEKEIAATFSDVLLTDLRSPDERHATISGNFRFIFNRGRPAQRFP